MSNFSKRKKLAFSIISVAIIGCLTLFVMEIMVRLVAPVPSLYPRWEYSPEYGHRLYKNAVMTHETPGEWRFTYTINEYGYRGPAIPISNEYDKKNIVVLGDSNAFGQGVNDGEEFPQVLMQNLHGDYNVINLAVGGYGLTQQIRRYYEFGQLYQPSIVILQFAKNDPGDNFYNRVTAVENGKFAFKRIYRPEGGLKKYLSQSIIQKSQLYNFFRSVAFTWLKFMYLKAVYGQNSVVLSEKAPVAQQEFYDSLLETFARDLHNKGIRLIMISVYEDHGTAIDLFPLIKETAVQLNGQHYLDYIDISPWFEPRSQFPHSPEGHVWGKAAHNKLGHQLAQYILDTMPENNRRALNQ